MKRDYANELDLLRFLAALAVVIFHFSPRLADAYGATALPFEPIAGIARYGYMGVDLFFMISGFVVIASAQSGSLRTFAAGRITRLYPAFWFCCTLTVAVIVALGNSQHLTVTGWLANMTMYPRLFGQRYVDGTYWTLALELRFYLLLGCLILIGQIRNVERWMTGWLIVALLMMLFAVTPLRYVLLVDYASYFIAGAMFQFIRAHGITAMRVCVIAACLPLSMDHAVQVIAEQPLYADRAPIVACALTAVFYVVFAAVATRRTGRFGNLRWATLGVLTYPLYLMHQTVGMVLITHLRPAWPPAAVFTVAILLSLAAAYLVHRYIEVPFAPRLRALFPASRQKAAPLAVRAD